MTESEDNVPKSVYSPASITFWRHMVGMAILLTLLPPYTLGNISEFFGYSIGKILTAIIPATILTLIGGLFLTNTMKNRLWKTFVISAWVFGFIGLYFVNRATD